MGAASSWLTAGVLFPHNHAHPSPSALLAEAPRPQITRDEALQAQLRAAVETVRAKLNGLTYDSVVRIGRLYGEAGQRMAESLRLIVSAYGGEETWPQSATLSAQMRARRTQELLRQLDAILAGAVESAKTEVLQGALRSFRMGYYGEGWALDLALPSGVSALLPVLPDDVVRSAALYPYGGLTFFDRMGEQRPAFLGRMQRSIGISQASGDTLSQATSRLLRELGVPVGGGVPVSQRRQAAADALYIPSRSRGLTPRRHAELIARTELQRSAAAGAETLFDRNRDVLAGKEWQATNDARTCPICAALDGSVYTLDDPNAPTIPRHPRCRCALLPVLKPWSEILSGAPAGTIPTPKPRLTYRQWAEGRQVSPEDDGGLRQQRGRRLDRR